MRYFYLFLFTIASISTNGQEIIENPDTGMYESQGVVDIEGKSQDELFSRALEWVALNYNSANHVIQLEDKESGKIVVKGNFPSYMFGKKGHIKHTLRLEFKDSKFRYTYSDLAYDSKGSGEMPFEGSMYKKNKIIASTESDIKISIENMANFIKNQDSDW